MQKRRKRRYGVSVVSMLPRSLGKNGIENSIRMAEDAGYDGIQALPLRGWDYMTLSKWEHKVIAYEDAWDSGSLWTVLLSKLGLAGDSNPTLIDWMLFGKRSQIPSKATYISHRFEGNTAVEIHPDLSTNTNDYLDYVRQGGSVVWDTLHVRREHRVDGTRISDWITLFWELHDLFEDSISLIHVHPSREEIPDLLSGKGELGVMLRLLGNKTNVPAMVEVFPPLKTRAKTIEYLSELRVATKKWLK